jgi:pimeloyl-ACP methyl ester carboxylesterase
LLLTGHWGSCRERKENNAQIYGEVLSNDLLQDLTPNSSPLLKVTNSGKETKMKSRSFRIFAIGVVTTFLVFSMTRIIMAADIDTDELRTYPVTHRFIHGSLGDANFQICLPENWNGKSIISSRGFSGNEYSSVPFWLISLSKGYAYAASDEGWNRSTIVDQPEDKYFESRRRIVQLTNYMQEIVEQNYGADSLRTIIIGSSNGGHHTKWLLEDYPALYDGGLSMFGYNSALELFRGMANFLRNYDIIFPRIASIIEARTINPNWDPLSDPLVPPLSPQQIDALVNLYDVPAYLQNDFEYNIGQEPGSEFIWPMFYQPIVALFADSLEKVDPTYDPDGDGEISIEEMKDWDPYESPVHVQNELRKPDLSGNLRRPLIIGQGLLDALVVPEENRAYKQLVEQTIGTSNANSVLRVYLVPGMVHGAGGALFAPFVAEALDALDMWVDFMESEGASGAVPGDIMSIPPL